MRLKLGNLLIAFLAFESELILDCGSLLVSTGNQRAQAFDKAIKLILEYISHRYNLHSQPVIPAIRTDCIKYEQYIIPFQL